MTTHRQTHQNQRREDDANPPSIDGFVDDLILCEETGNDDEETPSSIKSFMDTLPYDENYNDTDKNQKASDAGIKSILQQILETQKTILKEVRQQQKDIIQIKEKQKHIEQNLTESLAKQSKKILQLQVFVEKISNVVCAGKAETRNPPENFKKLAVKEDLDNFNTQLQNDEYRETVCTWLDGSLTKGDVKNRMHEARDIIFDPELFAGCSWKGGPSCNPKIPLANYKHILEVFRVISSNHHTKATEKDVEDFFKLKLRYGKDRLKLKGLSSISILHTVDENKN